MITRFYYCLVGNNSNHNLLSVTFFLLLLLFESASTGSELKKKSEIKVNFSEAGDQGDQGADQERFVVFVF